MRNRRSLAVTAFAFFGLIHCGGSPKTSAPPAAPTKASVAAKPSASTSATVVTVEYREMANAFEILDNAALWLPDKNGPEYRKDLEKRVGFGAAASSLDGYREVRTRYYAEERSHGEEERERDKSLFGNAKPLDRVADAFYGSSSLDDALSRLRAFMKPNDVETVRTYFAAWLPKIKPLLDESAASFGPLTAALQSRLGSARSSDYLAHLRVFYGVEDVPPFRALYIWWPDGDTSSASNRGNTVLLRYHPKTQMEDAAEADDIVVHELTHWISSHQSLAERQALTKKLTDGCDLGGRMPPLSIIEEPLAVVHQKLYLAAIAPDRLEFSSSWYGDPWVGTFAKLLYPQVKEAHDKGRHLDETLMRRAARVCTQLKALAGSFRAQESAAAPKPSASSSR